MDLGVSWKLLFSAPILFLSEYALTLVSVPQGTVIAKKVNWVGCQGSEPHFRGFPCSLWVLFHFLTVQATRRNIDPSQEAGESVHPQASA